MNDTRFSAVPWALSHDKQKPILAPCPQAQFCVCSVRKSPCLGKEVQAVMGSDSHKRYSIMNASIFSFKTKFLIAF